MISGEQSECLRWNMWVYCTVSREHGQDYQSLNYMHDSLMPSPAFLALQSCTALMSLYVSLISHGCLFHNGAFFSEHTS